MSDPELSGWAKSAVLTEHDYDLMRSMAANRGRHLIGRFGAEKYRFEELVKAGLVKPMSACNSLAPGYELTGRGVAWALDDAESAKQAAESGAVSGAEILPQKPTP